MPLVRDLEAAQSTEFHRSMSPDARGRLGKAKLIAAQLIPVYRAVLFPEDDDG